MDRNFEWEQVIIKIIAVTVMLALSIYNEYWAEDERCRIFAKPVHLCEAWSGGSLCWILVIDYETASS
jgi:hypothetical protein